MSAALGNFDYELELATLTKLISPTVRPLETFHISTKSA